MPRRLIPLIFLTIIFLFLPISLTSSIRSRAIRTLSPVTSYLLEQSRNVQSYFRSIGQIGALRRERTNLQEEVLRLQEELASKEKLASENELLRKELGIQGAVTTTPKVFAHVILQGNDPLDRTYVVDAGKNQGVREGQPVVVHGFLVGRVTEVRESSAVVRSLLSPRSTIQAWITESNEKGLVRGDGNTVALQEISQGVEVQEGQPVETSGLRGSLPPGIPIGTIGAKLSDPSDPTQRFRLTLTVDPSNIEAVMILLTDPPQ